MSSRQVPRGRPCLASTRGGRDASAAGQMTTAPSARSGLEPGGSVMVINQLPGTRAATQDPSGTAKSESSLKVESNVS